MKGIKSSSAKITIPIRKTPIVSATSKPRLDIIQMNALQAKQKLASTKISVIKLHAIEKAPKKSKAVDLSKKSLSVIKSKKSVTSKAAMKGSRSIVTKKLIRVCPTAAGPTIMKRRTLTAAALKKLAPVVKKTPRKKKPTYFEFKGSEWSGNSDDEGKALIEFRNLIFTVHMKIT